MLNIKFWSLKPTFFPIKATFQLHALPLSLSLPPPLELRVHLDVKSYYGNLQKIEKYIITLLAGIYQFLSFWGDAYRMWQIFSLHIAIAPLVGRPGLL